MTKRWLSSAKQRWLIGTLLAAGVIFVVVANVYVISANRARLFTDLKTVPARSVALVLGANASTASGQPNLHFTHRMDAAAALYHAGKVRHLLLSGDNHRVGYDEPAMMRDALLTRGVPVSAMTCDYAGFRTLDSVVRAQRIFAVRQCVIVTQRYHNTRALEIARANGLDAIGFCAADVELRASLKTELREIAARAVTVLDLYVWHRAPRFLGRQEPITAAIR